RQIPEGTSFGDAQGAPMMGLQMEAHKSGALFYINNEWLDDASLGMRARLEKIFATSLRWYVESLLWGGTGAGEALGAIAAPGTLEISKEVGQPADSIFTENVVKMWARLLPGSHSRALWAANPTCFPYLATLYMAVGAGGSVTSLLQTGASSGLAGAPATNILGRPLHFSEHLPVLGNAGDLMLLDPLMYLLGDRKVITLDASQDYRFGHDQTAFRAKIRFDGQPILDDVFTPANGDTCGWAVKIEERA
ncbi:MAG: phage major capsid protein, partial [Phycisphaerae bacterium]|nr:phage major capsid protein [Phycisphaerae bacterium]